jgi:hypothetical protein
MGMHDQKSVPVGIDRAELQLARELTGSASDGETVGLALRTLIAIRRQPAAAERIISRRLEPGQIDAPTVTPPSAAHA